VRKRLAAFLTRWQWVLLFMTAPFLLFPSPNNSLAMLVIPILWVAAWLIAKEPLPRTPVILPLLLMAVMVLVSEFATFDMTYSLPKIAGMVLGLGMFYALVYSARAEKGIGVGLGLFLATGVGIAGLGLLGTNWFNKIAFLQPVVTRLPAAIRGLPGAESGFQPNEVAGALLWMLPMLLGLLVLIFTRKGQSERKLLTLRVAGLGLLLMTIFVGGVFTLTQSRTAFIALALALLFIPGVLLVRKWRWAYLISMAILVIGLAVTAWQFGWTQSLYASTSASNNSADALDTLNGRVEIWSRGINGIQDFPVTGMGMNVFRKTIDDLYPLFSISPELDIGHAHDEFLTAALDLGIPGLVAFLSLYLVSFWMLVRVWKWGGDLARLELTENRGSILGSPTGTRALVLGLGGGLLAHAIYGIADTVALGAKPGILFWMLLGLIAGLFAMCDDNISRSRDGLSIQSSFDVQEPIGAR
jgi:putative inorganic carbon (HCO3(-)) transporter